MISSVNIFHENVHAWARRPCFTKNFYAIILSGCYDHDWHITCRSCSLMSQMRNGNLIIKFFRGLPFLITTLILLTLSEPDRP